MASLTSAHQRAVFGRRVRVLADGIASLLPPDARVLDVGCGDGSIAAAVLAAREDVTISGIDVLVRPVTKIAVEEFDGRTIPHPEESFDVVTMIDVLHHTADPAVLLREATRVARTAVILKDHVAESPWDRGVLRAMDWVGNKSFGVALPYNYWSRARWNEAYAACGLRIDRQIDHLGLYPPPASWVFERHLHLLERLAVDRPA